MTVDDKFEDLADFQMRLWSWTLVLVEDKVTNDTFYFAYFNSWRGSQPDQPAHVANARLPMTMYAEGSNV